MTRDSFERERLGNGAEVDLERADVVLLVFAKEPLPGNCKTRLGEEIGLDRAAALAAAFLEDTLDRVLRGGAHPVWLLGDHPGRQRFDRYLRPGVEYRYQGEGTLGDRLTRAFRDVLSGPARGAVAIGADTPHLPLERLSTAFEDVRRGFVTLGPAKDGGFYLIGVPRGSTLLDRPLSGIDWGTDRVLAQTRQALRATGRPWRELEEFWDIDVYGDLVQWMAHLSRNGPPNPPPARSIRLLRRLLES